MHRLLIYRFSIKILTGVTKINLHAVLFNICKLNYLKWTKRFGVLKIASCIINNSQFHMFDTKSYICYSEQMTQMQLCNCADFVRTVRNYCWQKLIWILYRQKYCEVWGRTTSINECSLLSKYLLWRKNIILFQLISPIFLEAFHHMPVFSVLTDVARCVEKVFRTLDVIWTKTFEKVNIKSIML